MAAFAPCAHRIAGEICELCEPSYGWTPALDKEPDMGLDLEAIRKRAYQPSHWIGSGEVLDDHLELIAEVDRLRAALEEIAALQHNPTMADTRPAAYRIARKVLNSGEG